MSGYDIIPVMKVFFSTATQNVVRAPDFYKNLMYFIESLGAEITRDWVKECIENINKGKRHLDIEDWQRFYKKVKQDIKQADAMIFDVTSPSIGVGLILGIALQRRFPILILVPREGFKAFSKGLVSGVKEAFVTTRVVKTREDYYSYIKEFLQPLILDRPTKRFLLRLSDKEYRKIGKLAKERKVSINRMIRELINSSV